MENRVTADEPQLEDITTPDYPTTSVENGVISDEHGHVNWNLSNLNEALPRIPAGGLDSSVFVGHKEGERVMSGSSSGALRSNSRRAMTTKKNVLREAALRTGEGSSRSTAINSSLESDSARNRNTVAADSHKEGETEMIYQLLKSEAEARSSPVDSILLRQTAGWLHKESCFHWENFKEIYLDYGKDRHDRHNS